VEFFPTSTAYNDFNAASLAALLFCIYFQNFQRTVKIQTFIVSRKKSVRFSIAIQTELWVYLVPVKGS
jgi:hypothetical protein